ncbi:MAG: hypothetical protein V8Q71_04940 [Bacilli bacterium]
MMDKIINLLKGEMTFPQILLYKYKDLGLTEKRIDCSYLHNKP